MVKSRAFDQRKFSISISSDCEPPASSTGLASLGSECGRTKDKADLEALGAAG
jgi:hypothetical protein